MEVRVEARIKKRGNEARLTWPLVLEGSLDIVGVVVAVS